MGSLHQQAAEGELVLEQNDGVRRLYWSGGNLRYLHSDAGGEQFGNFLIRRGVLDMAALKELLADGEGARVGDRVIQWGLMTQQERDAQLHELLGSILLHALEHPILQLTWQPGPLAGSLSGDLQFSLDHRRLVWDVFQTAQIDQELQEMFRSEPDWRWQAPPDLLLTLADLPLNPHIAYALSLMGSEPLGCDTLTALTGLESAVAARLVAALWTLGGLRLTRGTLTLLPRTEPPPPPPPPPAPTPPAPLPPIEVESIQILPEDLEPEMDPPAPPEAFADPASYEGGALELDMPSPAPPAALPSPPLPAVAEGEDTPALRARKLFVKAKSYLMQDRTSEAIRTLEQSVKLDADSPEAYETWLLLGRLRTSNPAWSTRAIEALQVASRLKPKAAEPWALMGELYHRKGFKANAQGCFRRALDLDPSVAVPTDLPTASSLAPSGREGEPTILGRLGSGLRAMLGRQERE